MPWMILADGQVQRVSPADADRQVRRGRAMPVPGLQERAVFVRLLPSRRPITARAAATITAWLRAAEAARAQQTALAEATAQRTRAQARRWRQLTPWPAPAWGLSSAGAGHHGQRVDPPAHPGMAAVDHRPGLCARGILGAGGLSGAGRPGPPPARHGAEVAAGRGAGGNLARGVSLPADAPVYARPHWGLDPGSGAKPGPFPADSLECGGGLLRGLAGLDPGLAGAGGGHGGAGGAAGLDAPAPGTGAGAGAVPGRGPAQGGGDPGRVRGRADGSAPVGQAPPRGVRAGPRHGAVCPARGPLPCWDHRVAGQLAGRAAPGLADGGADGGPDGVAACVGVARATVNAGECGFGSGGGGRMSWSTPRGLLVGLRDVDASLGTPAGGARPAGAGRAGRCGRAGALDQGLLTLSATHGQNLSTNCEGTSAENEACVWKFLIKGFVQGCLLCHVPQ